MSWVHLLDGYFFFNTIACWLIWPVRLLDLLLIVDFLCLTLFFDDFRELLLGLDLIVADLLPPQVCHHLLQFGLERIDLVLHLLALRLTLTLLLFALIHDFLDQHGLPLNRIAEQSESILHKFREACDVEAEAHGHAAQLGLHLILKLHELLQLILRINLALVKLRRPWKHFANRCLADLLQAFLGVGVPDLLQGVIILFIKALYFIAQFLLGSLRIVDHLFDIDHHVEDRLLHEVLQAGDKFILLY